MMAVRRWLPPQPRPSVVSTPPLRTSTSPRPLPDKGKSPAPIVVDVEGWSKLRKVARHHSPPCISPSLMASSKPPGSVGTGLPGDSPSGLPSVSLVATAVAALSPSRSSSAPQSSKAPPSAKRARSPTKRAARVKGPWPSAPNAGVPSPPMGPTSSPAGPSPPMVPSSSSAGPSLLVVGPTPATMAASSSSAGLTPDPDRVHFIFRSRIPPAVTDASPPQAGTTPSSSLSQELLPLPEVGGPSHDEALASLRHAILPAAFDTSPVVDSMDLLVDPSMRLGSGTLLAPPPLSDALPHLEYAGSQETGFLHVPRQADSASLARYLRFARDPPFWSSFGLPSLLPASDMDCVCVPSQGLSGGIIALLKSGSVRVDSFHCCEQQVAMVIFELVGHP